jgi:hypothetical protein
MKIICPGWPQASILPISAKQVARITGVSHPAPAFFFFFFNFIRQGLAV